MTESKYRLPTDRRIFESMSDTRRQTSTNLAAILDRDRRYISNRLKFLREKGYLYAPGPAEESRMVEPTTLGRIAIFHKDKLIRNYTVEFETFCWRIEVAHENIKEEFYPDLLVTETNENNTLKELNSVGGLTIPSELEDDLDDSIRASRSLYALYFWSLAERKDDMDVYEITSQGKQFLSLSKEDPFENPIFGDDKLRTWVSNTKNIRDNYTEMELDRLDKLTRCFPQDESSDVIPEKPKE